MSQLWKSIQIKFIGWLQIWASTVSTLCTHCLVCAVTVVPYWNHSKSSVVAACSSNLASLSGAALSCLVSSTTQEWTGIIPVKVSQNTVAFSRPWYGLDSFHTCAADAFAWPFACCSPVYAWATNRDKIRLKNNSKMLQSLVEWLIRSCQCSRKSLMRRRLIRMNAVPFAFVISRRTSIGRLSSSHAATKFSTRIAWENGLKSMTTVRWPKNLFADH